MEKSTKKHIYIATFMAFIGIGGLVFFSPTPRFLGGMSVESGNWDGRADNSPVAASSPVNIDFRLTARAVLVKDLRSNLFVYVKDPDKRVPIASLTKLMTALVAVKEASLEQVVTITENDTQTVEYTAGLVPGERLTILDLLRAMLISSANDAALALARGTTGDVERFVREMNEEASRLGMKDTFFTNPVGFDDPNHFSTAFNISTLLDEFLGNEVFREIVASKEALIVSQDSSFTHRLFTTNKLMLEHPEILGVKTGFTGEAKGNLISLNERFYSIVLGSDDREGESLTVLSWAKSNF